MYKKNLFVLKNFEGPLDFLLQLIQKDEVDICDVFIQDLTQQFLTKFIEDSEPAIEEGAEFIGMTAYLVWLKSRRLLPQEVPTLTKEEEELHADMIQHLLDYCRFKQTAKELTQRQERQQTRYARGLVPLPEMKKSLGLHHLSLDELNGVFKEMMQRLPQLKPIIPEENWRVADKIRVLRHLLKEQTSFALGHIFLPEQSRIEWIVIFLALLELMKIGEVCVAREVETQAVVIFAKEGE